MHQGPCLCWTRRAAYRDHTPVHPHYRTACVRAYTGLHTNDVDVRNPGFISSQRALIDTVEHTLFAYPANNCALCCRVMKNVQEFCKDVFADCIWLALKVHPVSAAEVCACDCAIPCVIEQIRTDTSDEGTVSFPDVLYAYRIILKGRSDRDYGKFTC